MPKTVKSRTLYGVRMHNAKHSRVIVEQEDGRFALVQDVIKEDGVRHAECTFTMDEALGLATLILEGNPAIRQQPHAGKILSAALVLMAEVSGLIKRPGNG